VLRDVSKPDPRPGEAPRVLTSSLNTHGAASGRKPVPESAWPSLSADARWEGKRVEALTWGPQETISRFHEAIPGWIASAAVQRR